MAFHVFFESCSLVGFGVYAVYVADLQTTVGPNDMFIETRLHSEFSFSMLGNHLRFNVPAVCPIYIILLSPFNLGIGRLDRKK